MAECINPDSLRMLHDQNICNPKGDIDGQPQGPDFNEGLESETANAVHEDQQTRKQAIQDINPRVDEQTGVPPDPVPSRDAEKAGKMFSFVDTKKGLQSAWERMVDTWRHLYGTDSIGQTNRLTQISEWLSYNFKDHLAPIKKYLIFANPFHEGKNIGANLGVEALTGVDSKAVGYMRDFRAEHFDPFLQEIKPTAEALGFQSPEEFARVIGEYQAMRHMPEANAYLLEKWKAMLGEEGADVKKIMRNIERLETYRDWKYQLDENGQGIVCAGRTDGYAREWLQRFHEAYNIDQATMENYAQRITDIAHKLNEWNINQGNVDMETVALLNANKFQHYVPLKTRYDLSKGLATDSSLLNAGNFHARDGMSSANELVSPFESVHNLAQKVAMDNAARPFGEVIYATIMNAKRQNLQCPFTMQKYSAALTIAQMPGSYGARYRSILEGEKGFLLTSMIPMKDANGNIKLTRMLFSIDNGYRNESLGISGAKLNEAMRLQQQSGFARTVSNATGFMAGLNTHYNVAFPFINMFKDAGERINNLFGQTYRLEDGTHVDGDKFLGSYVATLPSAAKFLSNIMMSKVPDIEASPIGKYWKEYVTQGVKQEFDPIWNKEGSELSSVLNEMKRDPKMGPVLGMIKGFDDATRKRIINAFHNYNDYFNNIPAFAQFVALRKNGVTVDSARSGTLEVINLRESGRYTGALRMLYAFAKPTVQGAASLARALGFSPNAAGQFKPNLKGIAVAMSTMAAVAMAYNVAKSMGGEENMDKLSMDDVSHYLFVPTTKNGDTIKLPLPFGPVPVLAAMAVGADRVLRGKMDPIEYLGHVVRQTFKATTPAEFPAYSMSDAPLQYAVGLITPSLLQPIMQVTTNKGYFGNPLTYGDPNSTEPMYMQGRVSTPSGWHKFAKILNQVSGGFLNYAPEQVKALVEGYMGGITRVLPDAISRDSLASMGFDESTQGILGRAMSVLGMSMVYKKIPQTHTQEFYTEYEKLKAEIRGFGIRLSEKGAYRPDEREDVWRDKLEEAGMDSDKIERYLAMYQVEQDKKKLSTELKKQTTLNPDFPDLSEAEIKQLFNDYTDACEELYLRGLGL